MIRALQEELGVKIDIEDDGRVFIAATDGIAEQAARDRIEALTESAQVGRIYTGKVVRIADFGAFVQILPNIDGMVHISQLDSERVNKVEDIVSMGDEITVMVTAIDENGKIRLSRQAVLDGWSVEEALDHDRKSSRPSSGGRPGGSGRPSGGRPGGGGYNRGGGGGIAGAKPNPTKHSSLRKSGGCSSNKQLPERVRGAPLGVNSIVLMLVYLSMVDLNKLFT